MKIKRCKSEDRIRKLIEAVMLVAEVEFSYPAGSHERVRLFNDRHSIIGTLEKISLPPSTIKKEES